MSDPTLKISLQTSADISGAEKTRDALAQVKDQAKAAGAALASTKKGTSSDPLSSDTTQYIEDVFKNVQEDQAKWEADMQRQIASVEEAAAQGYSDISGILALLKQIPGPLGDFARGMFDVTKFSGRIGGDLGSMVGLMTRLVSGVGIGVTLGLQVKAALDAWAAAIEKSTAESERLGAAASENLIAILRQVDAASSLAEREEVVKQIEEERSRINKELAEATGEQIGLLDTQMRQLDRVAATLDRTVSARKLLAEAGRAARIEAAAENDSLDDRITAAETLRNTLRQGPANSDTQKELEAVEKLIVGLREKKRAEEEEARAIDLKVSQERQLGAAIAANNIDKAENIQFSIDYAKALKTTSGNEKLALSIATEAAAARRKDREELIASAEAEAALAKAIQNKDKATEESLRRRKDYTEALKDTGGDTNAAQRIADAKAVARAAENAAKDQKDADREAAKQKKEKEDSERKAIATLQDRITLERERGRTAESSLKSRDADEKTIAKARMVAAEKVRELEMQIAKLRGDSEIQAAIHSEQRKQDALAIAAAEAVAQSKASVSKTAGGSLFDGTNRRRGAITSDAMEQPIGLGGSALDQFATTKSAPVGAVGGKSPLTAAAKSTQETAGEMDTAASELQAAASDARAATKAVVAALGAFRGEINAMKQQIKSLSEKA